MDDSLTWQEAKAETQRTELEIASVLPSDAVLSIDQPETGSLFSCDDSRHRWAGETTITLVSGTDHEALVDRLIDHYKATDAYEVTPYRDSSGLPQVKLVSKDGGGAFAAGPANGDQFTIDSRSACFTLPDDVYPGGGDF